MADKTISRIKFEIGQVDQLFESYADLLERVRQDTPDLVEVTALASVLHSFYNGLENIFLTIAKEIDGNVPPTGNHWHRDLLTQMTVSTPNRREFLTTDMAHRLADYLGFRHFYQHSYSFVLDWDELEKLVKSLGEVWEQTKAQVEIFMATLSE